MEFEAPIATADMTGQDRRVGRIAFAVMVALIAIAPFFAYPFFVMQAMCFALFACAFNLLIGYANLLSLGHAMFFGLASYVCAHAAKVWGLEPVSAITVGSRTTASTSYVSSRAANLRLGTPTRNRMSSFTSSRVNSSSSPMRDARRSGQAPASHSRQALAMVITS